MSIKHPIVKSFPYAIDGIKTAFKNEPNFRVHVVLGLAAITLGIFLEISTLEFAILFVAIGMVIILELINTTLEALVDLVSPDVAPQAKIAKDVSAAAVLASALLSVAVGSFIFLPKIF